MTMAMTGTMTQMRAWDMRSVWRGLAWLDFGLGWALEGRISCLAMWTTSLQHYYTGPPSLTRPWREDIGGPLREQERRSLW